MDKHTDIVIIGSGVAALQAARILGQQFEVHIVTKSSVYTSSSYKAQGGIAAVTSKNDQLHFHTQDTLEAGVYHHDKGHVESLVRDGTDAIHQLIEEGLAVDYTPTREISLGLEGAHSHPRIIHAGGDRTGKALVDYLLEQLPPKVTIHPYEMAYELLLNTAGECIGIKTLHEGITESYFAHHVILASGGAAALYPQTSNFNNNTGDGIALAYRAGVAITDMEFMQFHPSLLYVNGETKGLVSEAVRGEGGKFVDENGHALMDDIHPLKDLAPRHITAYEMFKNRAQGKEVYLDISMIKDFEHKFPTITELCLENSIDLSLGRIPIAPGSHFLMGGVIADDCGRTSIRGLYAVGEVACTGVHGANRLASNSLLEGVAFGKNMANYIAKKGCKQTNFLLKPKTYHSNNVPLLLKNRLKQELITNVGIIRNEEGLKAMAQLLPSLQELYQVSLETLNSEEIELFFMHTVATIITTAALQRTESRGAHIRSDYPNFDNDWQHQWIIFQQGTMKVRGSLYEQHQAGRYA